MKLIFISVLTLGFYVSVGQDLSLMNTIPPSPEATAFTKYGTYPVGTYTGKPDITIPLYEIKTQKLTLPISLNYDATGIKVNDHASWVGMNWSLNAGGMISCVILGRQDISSPPPRVSDVVDNSTYLTYFEALVDGIGANVDGEPDKYFFSINGRSGSFVFDRDRNIQQIPKTSIKITANDGGFKIVDEGGTVYVFKEIETTETNTYFYEGTSPYATRQGDRYKVGNSAYYITEIVSNDGIEKITFQYENDVTDAKEDSYAESYGDRFTWNPGVNQYTSRQYIWTGQQRTITSPKLKTITFANGKIEFSRVQDRQDYVSGLGSRLDEITLYASLSGSYSKVKSFKFKHGYYYSNIDYAQHSAFPKESQDKYRLRLDSIILKSAESKEISRYTFSYNAVQPPPKTSCAQDLEGYYNGYHSNTTLVPETEISSSLTIGGANRSSVESYMKAGILEKITYPTGGYTVFEMESHQLPPGAVIVSDGAQAYAHGMTSNNLTVKTFAIDALTFKPGNGTVSISFGPYAATDPQPFVKIKNVTTNQEDTYTSPDRTQFYNTSVPYDFTAGHSYEITSSSYGTMSYSFASIQATYRKVTTASSPTLVGGLRVKSIKNYHATGVLSFEELYKYGAEESGMGILAGLRRSLIGQSYGRQIVVYYPINGNQCWTQSGFKSIYTDRSLYDPVFIYGSPIVYTDVVKYYGNGTQNAGKIHHYYGPDHEQWTTTAPLPLGQALANYTGVIAINNTWKKGLLKMEKKYKNIGGDNYIKVSEKEDIYNTPVDTVTYGFFANTKFERVNFSDYCLVRTFSDYAYAEYPVHSGYIQKTRTIEKYYEGTSSIETVTDYTYDNTFKDINTVYSTVNSKSQVVETTRRYPFNKTALHATEPLTTAESLAIDTMIARNLIGVPIEEITKEETNQTYRKRTQFEIVNSKSIVPVAEKLQIGSSPGEERILYPKYSIYGNLTEQQKINDVKQSYIWSYNDQYPIATALNAPVKDIFHTSFEETEGNSTGAKTGKRSKTGGYAKSLTNLTAGKYILSYWQKSGSTWNYVEDNNITVSGTSYQINIPSPAHVDEVRFYPFTAQMITYTYDPLIGMTSQCDVDNMITYYEYDDFGRLKHIRDQDKNIVKKICYNYAGQPENCVQFPNDDKSGNYTRNNCGTGYVGSSVYVSIPGGMFTSSVSVADANLQATNYGQAQANLNGTCTAVCTNCTGRDKKCINGVCKTGIRVNVQSYPFGSGYRCVFYYRWSDGSTSPEYFENTSQPCMLD